MSTDHPHTVRSSPVPFYMQGFPRLGDLGQDDPTSFWQGDVTPDVTTGDIPDFTPAENIFLDTGITIPEPGTIDTTMFEPTGGLVYTGPTVSSNTQDIANLYAGAVASGAMTPAQAAIATAQAVSAAASAAKAFKPALGPGASPRVAVRPPGQAPAGASILTQQSIPGVPNWALLAAAGVAMLAMGRR